MGQCKECEKWSTLEEEQTLNESNSNSNDKEIKKTAKADTSSLNEISKTTTDRIKTKLDELNLVLGGGFVPGSLILLGGEPGIGKSTLSLQIGNIIEDAVYFSGEESLGQVKIRAERLDIDSNQLQFAQETETNKICSTIDKIDSKLAIVDSIQTLRADDISGQAGNRKQIQASSGKIQKVAKKTDTAILMIGHVTKDGGVAGPKTLEHLVDTVLYFEGEKNQSMRLLRSVKNRFGATDEVGVFDMTQEGLKQIKNPSSSLLAEREDDIPGSVVTALMEGTRPLLVEIQALVNKTVYGNPARKASGFDLNRLHVLSAVLQKRAKLNLAEYDIHINVIGGLDAREPASDLAVCFAIASAYNNKPLSKNLAVFGEVGLGGEVRSVSNLEKRLNECNQLGVEKVITKVPEDKNLESFDNLQIISVKNIKELVDKT
jgi:DNA repair protein RadA/Sms